MPKIKEVDMNVNKRYADFIVPSEKATKRQRFDDNSPSSACMYSNGTNAERGSCEPSEKSRPLDDMDDDFFLSQDEELHKMEQLATQQRPRVRETHRFAPDFESRPSVQPKSTTPLENGHDRDSDDRYLLADDVAINLERANAERERYLIEKTRLEEQLVKKDGEIKILRERLKIFEKDKMQKQVESSQAAMHNKSEFDSAMKRSEEAINRMKSELEFMKQEKFDILERLSTEVKRRESLECRLANVVSGSTTSEHKSPLTNRNTHNSIGGPNFPDRRSFYNGIPTQPPVGQKVFSVNVTDICNDGAPNCSQEENFVNITPKADLKKAPIQYVNQAAQTEERLFLGRNELVPSEALKRYRLTGRLREGRPSAIAGNNQLTNGISNTIERNLGDILAKFAVLTA